MADLMKKLPMLFAPFLLSSCLTINASIDLSDNFSGVFRYSASISTLATDLEQVDPTGLVIPFPLNKVAADTAAEAGGIVINKWEELDDGSRINMDCELSFADLPSLGTYGGFSLTSESSGNNSVLSVIVYQSESEEGISQNVLDIVNESFFEDYIEIQIVIPGDIIRVVGATFSGKTVTFRISVAEMLQSASDVQFTVEYR